MDPWYQPRRRFYLVVPTLIGLNSFVFVMWQFYMPPPMNPGFLWMNENFTTSWNFLVEGRVWGLLTSVFSHSLLLHFFINMFVLYSFGTLMERVLGSMSFLRFYLIAGIMGSLAHCVVSYSLIGDPSVQALGASGAIAGVLLYFALLFPKEKILLFGLIPIPALIGALMFIGLDLWGLTAQARGGGLPIGHGAHLGGAFTGIFFYFLHRRRRQRRRFDPYFS